MANSENESVWEVLGEARLGATCDMPFAYRVGLPDEPEIIDVSTKKIIKPRAIRIKNVTLTELLDRIEAALKRNGNAAAMREALEFVAHLDDDSYTSYDIAVAVQKANDALSAPPRQCDVGTGEEQTSRLRAVCNKFKPSCNGCKYITDLQKVNCWLAWAQMPYEGGAM